MAGLESASLPFEMKKTASVSKLLDKNCTFVNGGLWLVKKINVFFLTSLFPYTKQQIYYNYQALAMPFQDYYSKVPNKGTSTIPGRLPSRTDYRTRTCDLWVIGMTP